MAEREFVDGAFYEARLNGRQTLACWRTDTGPDPIEEGGWFQIAGSYEDHDAEDLEIGRLVWSPSSPPLLSLVRQMMERCAPTEAGKGAWTALANLADAIERRER